MGNHQLPCDSRQILLPGIGIIATYQAWHSVCLLLQPELDPLQPELPLFDSKNMRWVTATV